MKKIVVVTFAWDNANYGQILQAFALQRYLRDTNPNVKVEVLHFMPDFNEVATFRAKIKRILGRKIVRFIRAIKRVLRALMRSKAQRLEDKKRESIAKTRDFMSFKREFISLDSPEWRYFCDIEKSIEGDIFIVGSDQVWNPWQILENATQEAIERTILGVYTLPWVKDKPKIAYAASFGRAEIPLSEREYFARNLGDFRAISVRENVNVATIENLGLKARFVCDPTLLLARKSYERIIPQGVAMKSDAFCYILGHNHDIEKMDAVMRTLERHCAKILYTHIGECSYFDEFAIYPTIPQWLACMRDTRFVLTNSFHGSVFAIIFQKPFAVMRLEGEASAMNTRIESLLGTLGLESRILRNAEDLERLINTPIAWDNDKLARFRADSKAFLQNALNGLV